MTVTLDDLEQTIFAAFEAQATQSKKFDSVFFFLNHDSYHIRVQLVLRFKYSHDPKTQDLVSMLSLVRPDGSDIDYAAQPFREVLAVCHELQRTMSWGTIGPIRHNNGLVTIHTQRRFNTSVLDLARAKRNDGESELITSIRALAQELNSAAFALTCFAEGTVGAMRISMLLNTPKTPLLM